MHRHPMLASEDDECFDRRLTQFCSSSYGDFVLAKELQREEPRHLTGLISRVRGDCLKRRGGQCDLDGFQASSGYLSERSVYDRCTINENNWRF